MWEPIDALSGCLQAWLLDAGYQPVLATSLHAVAGLLADIAIVAAGDADIGSVAEIAASGTGTSVIVLRDQSCALTPAAFLAVGARSVLPRGVSGEICTLATRAAELGCSVSLTGDAVADLPHLAGVIARIGPPNVRGWPASPEAKPSPRSAPLPATPNATCTDASPASTTCSAPADASKRP